MLHRVNISTMKFQQLYAFSLRSDYFLFLNDKKQYHQIISNIIWVEIINSRLFFYSRFPLQLPPLSANGQWWYDAWDHGYLQVFGTWIQ